jgi:hypothetical protein
LISKSDTKEEGEERRRKKGDGKREQKRKHVEEESSKTSSVKSFVEDLRWQRESKKFKSHPKRFL